MLFKPKSEKPKRIKIFDTTLRDGEQMPGVSLTPEKKLRIAHMLDELGVNVIEGGFARVSEGDLQALRLMAKEGLKAELCSMVRANKGDVDAALKAEVQSIHLVVPTSQLHLKYKLKKEPEEILSLSQEVVEYAKDHGLVVELSAEDGSRTDVDFLKRFFSQGISAGADRICLCDTVGVLTPPKAFDLLSQLREKFQVPLSIHCHDDFGMAVANTLEGLRAGADQAHVTVNGLGERAGNAALEEVVVGARYLLNLDSSITFNKLYEVSRLVSRLTGVNVQPNKAVVGDNAFAHESGIHVHAILSHPLTYEPLSPDVVGVKRRLVVGKHVGSAGIEALLRELGLKPTPEQLNEIFLRVKKLGDRGKTVTDSDLQAIAEAVLGLPSKRTIVLKELTVVTGDKVTPTASVKLEVDGREVVEAGIGIGPVDAAINAIKKLGASIADITLEEYHVKSITGGTDAVVEVIVKLRRGDRTVTASGARGDIVMASVEAVLSGMNTLMAEWLNKEKENS
ncbi:2-isopropylmalate synthase [Candidatus Hecatella orcuttiae]|uniref:2-isopropylmalate synthase n=1 Tax=Candidatus Hecatella orcuttiae TaxID=1935119 RepID=UPI0031836F25